MGWEAEAAWFFAGSYGYSATRTHWDSSAWAAANAGWVYTANRRVGREEEMERTSRGGQGELRGSIWAKVWREEGLVFVPLEEKMYWIASLKSDLSPSC